MLAVVSRGRGRGSSRPRDTPVTSALRLGRSHTSWRVFPPLDPPPTPALDLRPPPSQTCPPSLTASPCKSPLRRFLPPGRPSRPHRLSGRGGTKPHSGNYVTSIRKSIFSAPTPWWRGGGRREEAPPDAAVRRGRVLGSGEGRGRGKVVTGLPPQQSGRARPSAC